MALCAFLHVTFYNLEIPVVPVAAVNTSQWLWDTLY